MSNFRVLSSFKCPITLEVMDNPVILVKTSQTYEKFALEQWLLAHDTCPLTGVSLGGNHQTISNIALKESINEWQQFTDEALKSMKYEILFNEVTIDSLMAQGRSKDIFKGKFCWRPVAICISNSSCPAMSENEANILATIGKHPNIIRFIARSTNPEGKRVTVLELAPIGSLHNLVSNHFDKDHNCLPERILSTVLYQIANGMEEIHLNNVIHKDLAARNILVFSFDKIHPERIRVKIAGFDMSSIMEQNRVDGSDNNKSNELPIRWMAPETLTTNIWSNKSDVFSFGVLIWECLSGGEVPWGLGATHSDIQENIKRGDMLHCSYGWSKGLTNLMKVCCSLDMQSRPTFTKIKEILSPMIVTDLPRPKPKPVITEKRITITVVDVISGESLDFIVFPSMTISVIIRALERRWNIFSFSFWLMVDGNRLQPDRTLMHYGIEDGDLLELFKDAVGSIGIFGNYSHTPGIELLMTDNNNSNNKNREYDWIEEHVGSEDQIRTIVADIRKNQFNNNNNNNNNNNKESEVYCSNNSTFLNRSQCLQLRDLMDSKANDNSFDFKLPITIEELKTLIGEETVASLSHLMNHDFNSIILRRCQPQSLCIAFHLDTSFNTLQIALNDEEEYEGGRLVYALTNGTLLCPQRLAGTATRHDNTVVHGVTKHTAGIRYGLFLLKDSLTTH